MLAPVLSSEGALSRSDPELGQSESWPDRGAPERSTGWWPRWSAGRRCVLRHWARVAGVISCAGRSDFFASGVRRLRILAPPAAPSPPRGSRGATKTRTHCAARTRALGCLKFESLISCPGRDAAFFHDASQNRDRTKRRRSLRPRLCSAPLRKCYALRCVRGT
jgi:hypothetical protein